MGGSLLSDDGSSLQCRLSARRLIRSHSTIDRIHPTVMETCSNRQLLSPTLDASQLLTLRAPRVPPTPVLDAKIQNNIFGVSSRRTFCKSVGITNMKETPKPFRNEQPQKTLNILVRVRVCRSSHNTIAQS